MSKELYVISEDQARVLDDISIINSLRAIVEVMHNGKIRGDLQKQLNTFEAFLMNSEETPKTLEEYLYDINNNQ